ncbi:MAG: MBL fold metallo-hydrolase [Candidatus Buchananbacteria bacterium]
MDVSLKFLGGLATTENLTGSCTAIEVKRGKQTTVFLIDAGLVQGDNKNFLRNNRRILEYVEPKRIDFVILTHSHIDHIGLLPLLVSRGFRGRIVCTEQTADLMPIMLEDSYKVQKGLACRNERRNKARANAGSFKKRSKQKEKVGKSRNSQPHQREQLFQFEDVQKTLKLIYSASYGKQIKLAKGITLQFHPSGHILGGAICTIETIDPRNKNRSRLAFSGDLGRQEGLLLLPPEKLNIPVDYWFTESTYGGKQHPSRTEEISKLFGLIAEAEKEGKRIIIPSFALQRTQELIYLLSAAMERNEIPRIPINLDSPMAIAITEVFAKYWDLGAFSNKFLLGFNPFSENTNPNLKFHRSPEESAELMRQPAPRIIIASSGMCDAGRIRDHLRANLGSEMAIICLVGYMAPTSLGAKLKKKPLFVQMNEDNIKIQSKIEHFESFSAHADSVELVNYAQSVFSGNKRSLNIIILHGETDNGKSLKDKLEERFRGRDVAILLPKLGDSMTLPL